MAKPGWLIPKKKPNTSKISTRNVVKKHLKEWNFDDDEEYDKFHKDYGRLIEDIKTEKKIQKKIDDLNEYLEERY